MNHAFGLSTIRTWNQAYQIETEFDPDDEMVFMAETAEACR